MIRQPGTTFEAFSEAGRPFQALGCQRYRGMRKGGYPRLLPLRRPVLADAADAPAQAFEKSHGQVRLPRIGYRLQCRRKTREHLAILRQLSDGEREVRLRQ